MNHLGTVNYSQTTFRHSQHKLHSLTLQVTQTYFTIYRSTDFHLHLSLSENCRLALWEVYRRGRYSHRCAGLDRYSLGGSLWLAVRLYLWIWSDHHGFLLVISERQGPPTPSRWVILLPMFGIAAAVRFYNTFRKNSWVKYLLVSVFLGIHHILRVT